MNVQSGGHKKWEYKLEDGMDGGRANIEFVKNSGLAL